ncbi:MAG TPA: PEP/pyruvate-binding domain-containing protein, partial [Dehalococcoidia bacterium]|nr:PEP/pyruvate-binding domain-containing protein [Dehalococcoidia bacterium]
MEETSEESKPIVWLREVGKDEIDLVGGKGANLGELVRAQIPVPPAFIVTTRAYFRFMEAAGLRPRLQTALAAVDIDNSSQLQKAAAAIKAAIRG